MKKLPLLILLSSIVLFTLVSCSKDKAIERRLHRTGDWKVTSLEYTITDQTNNGQNVFTGTASNVGKFTFDKGGSGSFDFTVEGYHRTGTFGWEVSDRSITLVRTSMSTGGFMNPSSITQNVVAITGTEESKNRYILEGTETVQKTSGSNIEQFVLVGKFILEKE
ncbi:MAG: hypothetical protein ACK4ND_00260 [Cytophagaceae bacterium]